MKDKISKQTLHATNNDLYDFSHYHSVPKYIQALEELNSGTKFSVEKLIGDGIKMALAIRNINSEIDFCRESLEY